MNETIIVPNAKFVSDVIYNYSYAESSIIIRNDVGVAYASDIDLVVDILQEAAARSPYAKSGKEPTVLVKEFGSSSINIAVLTWISDVKDKYLAQHWTNLEIWRAFKKNGIEIPFPQNDVYIKEAPKPAPEEEV